VFGKGYMNGSPPPRRQCSSSAGTSTDFIDSQSSAEEFSAPAGQAPDLRLYAVVKVFAPCTCEQAKNTLWPLGRGPPIDAQLLVYVFVNSVQLSGYCLGRRTRCTLDFAYWRTPLDGQPVGGLSAYDVAAFHHRKSSSDPWTCLSPVRHEVSDMTALVGAHM